MQFAQVKVIVPGYVRDENGVERATSNTILIREDDAFIVVDPGLDRKALHDALEREGVRLEQVKYVVLTHLHPDHALLAGVFGNASVIDDSSVYGWDGTIREHDGMIPGTDITILKTPGHDQFHCSVLVPTETSGTVAIVGDVFWWPDGETQETGREALVNRKDPYVKDWTALRASREKILDLANIIIPGHGKPFDAPHD